MNFDLFSTFHTPFGEWLDTLDSAGVSLRFEEESIPVRLGRAINRERVLAYERYTGVTTEERLEESLDEYHKQQQQRIFKGKTEEEIQALCVEHNQKSPDQRQQEFLEQARRQNIAYSNTVDALVDDKA